MPGYYAPLRLKREAYLVLNDFGIDSIALGARPKPKTLIARRLIGDLLDGPMTMAGQCPTTR
jgi:hypothetical protein